MVAHHEARGSRAFSRPSLLLAFILALACAGARGAAAHPGQWSPTNPRPHIQIHMVLMRGESPLHSRILTWDGRGGNDGEEIGWQPGVEGCGTGAWNSFTFGLGPWSPGANIFCDGHCHLAGTGGLLSAGGDDVVNEQGIRDARVFQTGSGMEPGAWTARAKMHRERFYPTMTALRDGRAIAVGGSRSEQLWVLGGRRNGSPPVGGTGDELHRLGRATDGIWDPVVTPAAPVDRPSPREGHTAVRLTPDVSAQVVFGGKDGGGNTTDSRVWLLTRRDSVVTHPDYRYEWSRRPTSGLTMVPRSDHVAIANAPSAENNTEMVIHGGLNQPNGALSATVLGEFRRLFKNSAQQWEWSNVIAVGSGPGARYGHAAVYDATDHRMYLFGGSSQTTGEPTDSQVWTFTFDNATNAFFASGTWGTLGVTGGPGPGPLRDHTMVLDPDARVLFVFGGSTTSALWKLNLSGTPTWSPVGAGGDVPAPRSGHTAFYDNRFDPGRLFLFGGEPTTATLLDEYAYTIDPLAAGPLWSKGALPAAARLSGHTMNIDATLFSATPPYARIPEIFTPGSGGSPGSWSLQTNSGLLSANTEQYPVQFLVPGTSIPSGGGRVMQVGPDPQARYLDLPASGLAGGWQAVPGGNSGFKAWSGVMYEPGKILIAGGKQLQVGMAVGTTKTLDASGTAGWQDQPPTQPTLLPRFNHTLLMLPTGQALAMGGENFIGPEHRPQIWTPGQGWTGGADLASDNVTRAYHSSAILLGDGRILTGGGRDCPAPPEPCPSKDLRLYCPPYLFNAQGNLAARPAITSAPSDLTWGQAFKIDTSDPNSVQKVCLMRPGAVTHSFDQNGRYVPLPIQGRDSNPPRLCVAAPSSPDEAPPGDYLLFILGSSDSPDVPSIARWVRLGADAGDLVPPDTTRLTPEIVGSNEVWFSWTATADDGQLPASGPARDFDLRYSYLGPINGEPSWGLASWAHCEPTPGPQGTWHEYILNNLQSCTTYNFALRPRDDNANLSGFHGPVSTQTTCGGGGGGGFAALPAEGGDEGGGVRAAAAGAPFGATSLQPTTGTLVSETRRLTNGAWRVSLRLFSEAEPLSATGSTITVDREGAGGVRDTLGRFTPGEGETLLGLSALRERGRVAILARYRLDQVMARFRHRGEDFVLSDAAHSRLGFLGAEFLASGGSVELLAEDVVELTYVPAAGPLVDPSPWYVLVRRQGTAPPLAFSNRRTLPDRLPERFALHPSEPNPVMSSALIRFDLPQESLVRLEVFDLLGRRVATLAGGLYPPGSHTATWNLRDAQETIRPGVYVCRISAGIYRAAEKLTVLP